jgi:hypothetical protein
VSINYRQMVDLVAGRDSTDGHQEQEEGGKGRPPEVVYLHDIFGLRVVSYFDEDEWRRVINIELRDGTDLMGNTRWRRVDRNDPSDLRWVARVFIDSVHREVEGDDTYIPYP